MSDSKTCTVCGRESDLPFHNCTGSKSIPPEVRIEQASIKIEQQQKVIDDFMGLVSELTVANMEMEANGRVMATALVDIKNIKGSPPIQVARTIAQRAIDKCAELLMRGISNEKQKPENPDSVLHRPGPASGPAEHEAGDIPG